MYSVLSSILSVSMCLWALCLCLVLREHVSRNMCLYLYIFIIVIVLCTECSRIFTIVLSWSVCMCVCGIQHICDVSTTCYKHNKWGINKKISSERKKRNRQLHQKMDEKDENNNVTRASIRCDKNNKENTAGDGERARKMNDNSCPFTPQHRWTLDGEY